jgi:hypothetical protein
MSSSLVVAVLEETAVVEPVVIVHLQSLVLLLEQITQ